MSLWGTKPSETLKLQEVINILLLPKISIYYPANIWIYQVEVATLI